jgi:hypothetical protein
MRFEHDGVVTPVNLAISTEFDWHLGNREGGDAMVLRRGDEIFEKTITPVQTGGVVRGFILGFVPSEFTRRATATGKAQGFIVVGCEDVRGKVIQERYELGKAPISYPMHHPGMRGSKD